MELSQAPYFGEFTFVYKGISIYVPVSLNDIARYKPDSFWDWLLFRPVRILNERFIDIQIYNLCHYIFL